MKSTPNGRYEVLSTIASGGMADVLLARMAGVAGFSKLVALKRIHRQHASDLSFVGRLIDEARIVADLTHPNIVQIFDLGESDGDYFIAMEYVHGRSLSQLLAHCAERNLRLSIDMVLGIALGACEGLAFAHGQKDAAGKPRAIVHRDVSPQNLLLSFDGVLKVADFGIASATGRIHQTQAGAVVGKLAYMSPEQMVGQRVDLRADVFALGVVVHELLTGKRLFGPQIIPSLRPKVIAPSTVNRDVPPGLDQIVLKAMSTDPAERYPDCGAMHAALEDVLVASGLVNSARRRAAVLQTWFPTQFEISSVTRGLDPGAAANRPVLVLDSTRMDRATLPASLNAARSSPSVRNGSAEELASDPGAFLDTVAVLTPADGMPASETPLEAQPTRIAGSALPSEPTRLLQPAPKPEPPPPPRAAPLPAPHRSSGHVTGPSRAYEVTSRRTSPLVWVLGIGMAALGAAGAVVALRWRSPEAAPAEPTPGAARRAAPAPAAEPDPSPSAPSSPPLGRDVPAAPSPSPTPPPARPTPVDDPPRSTHPTPRPGPDETLLAPTQATRKPTSEPSRRRGRLALEVDPPVQVYLGGELLGRTPLSGVTLPAGRTRLRLVDREHKVEGTLDVQVRPDGESRYRATLGPDGRASLVR